MNYIKALNACLAYIEENISSKLTPKLLSSLTGYSPYHFSRIFSSCTGLSLMDYIRRRRLTLAACSLLEGNRPIDVAADFGFETQTGFTKSFHLHFGLPPGAYTKTHEKREMIMSEDKPFMATRHQEKEMTAWNQENDTGANSAMLKYGAAFMKPEFITLPEIRIAGIGLATALGTGHRTRDAGASWDCLYGGPDVKAYLHEKLHPSKKGEIGLVSHDYRLNNLTSADIGRPLYVFGVEIDPGTDSSGFPTVVLKAATYARFILPPLVKSNPRNPGRNYFSESIREGWAYIRDYRIPGSGWCLDGDKPEFESYGDMAMQETHASMAFFVPIQKCI